MRTPEEVTPTPVPHDRRRRTLALLAGAGVMAASVFTIAACSGSDEASTTQAAAQGATTAPSTGEAENLTADFEMKPYDPSTKPVKPGPKTFTLTTTEKNIKVGDKVYRMWTFNNTVPGPILRAVEGDEITIKIRNDKTSQFHHSVDYHASRLTLGGGHVQVAPGKEGTFTFRAESPGVFMYHCATAPVVQHIGMGMYGTLIVQPKGGFGKDMPEYSLTQSEIYSGLDGIMNKEPAAMAFNGIPAQYLANPIKVKPNSQARFFVLNAGPSEVSSFHIVGTIFDKAYEDGNTDDHNLSVGRQTIPLAASGSTMVEARFVGEGKFPFVTHQFDHAQMGAVGMVLAGDGQPGPGAADDPASNGHH